MSQTLKVALQGAVLRLLEPLVRLLLDAGIGVGDFMSLVKIAYVRAARDEGRDSEGEFQRPNASRIAVVTGLTRVEVTAILEAGDSEAVKTARGRQRAERVLTGWWTDPDFQDSSGHPAVLPLKGGRKSFSALCRRYSGEDRTAPILDELLRVQAVRRLSDGAVAAISRTYATVSWNPEGVAAVGEQLHDHCASLLHNLKNPHRPLLIRRVLNARLNPRYAPVLMRDLERRVETLADAVQDTLNDPLHCVEPDEPADAAMTLGLGVYVFEDAGSQQERGGQPIKDQRGPSGGRGRRISRRGKGEAGKL